jgi:hypothetical protein
MTTADVAAALTAHKGRKGRGGGATFIAASLAIQFGALDARPGDTPLTLRRRWDERLRRLPQ